MTFNNTITLVTVCDNDYAVLLAALLKSIEVNLSPKTHIDLYIVGDRVRRATQRKLLGGINSTVFTTHWLTIEEAVPKGLRLPLDESTFPKNVYTRMFIPYFVPPTVEKVLYLDVDMIVLRDLTQLWQIDMGQHIIAGVLDNAQRMGNRWGGVANYEDFNLSPDTKLFNSGLLLLKPIAWRQQEIARQIIDCIEANPQHAIFADQYGLNVVLANQWLELDKKWNCYANKNEPDPNLIHFIGTKPIYRSYSFNKQYRDEFYKYLRLTPWRNFTPISRFQSDAKKIYNKIIKKAHSLLS